MLLCRGSCASLHASRGPLSATFFSKRSRKTNVLRILPRVPSKRKNRIQLYDFGSRLICSGGSIKTRLDHDGKFNFMILFLGRFVGVENQNHKVEVAFQKEFLNFFKTRLQLYDFDFPPLQIAPKTKS